MTCSPPSVSSSTSLFTSTVSPLTSLPARRDERRTAVRPFSSPVPRFNTLGSRFISCIRVFVGRSAPFVNTITHCSVSHGCAGVFGASCFTSYTHAMPDALSVWPTWKFPATTTPKWSGFSRRIDFFSTSMHSSLDSLASLGCDETISTLQLYSSFFQSGRHVSIMSAFVSAGRPFSWQTFLSTSSISVPSPSS